MMPAPMSGSPWPGSKYELVTDGVPNRTRRANTAGQAAVVFSSFLCPAGPQRCRSLEQGPGCAPKCLQCLQGLAAWPALQQDSCVARLHTHATLIQFNSICTMLRHEPTKPPPATGATATATSNQARPQSLRILIVSWPALPRPAIPMRPFQARRGSSLARQMKSSTNLLYTNMHRRHGKLGRQWLFCQPHTPKPPVSVDAPVQWRQGANGLALGEISPVQQWPRVVANNRNNWWCTSSLHHPPDARRCALPRLWEAGRKPLPANPLRLDARP